MNATAEMIMPLENKPIKRSRHLAILSHEHHEILLFVWKIRQGIIYNVPAATIGKYCGWFWDSMLKEHFEKEETVFPSLFAEDDTLFNTVKEDHEAIAKKIQQVSDEPSYFEIQRLAQIIYYHVRFEERAWFAHVEHLLNESQLSEIGLALATHKTTNRDVRWNNEFWKKSA